MGAVHSVGVDEHRAGVAAQRVVLLSGGVGLVVDGGRACGVPRRVARIPLHHHFVDAVAIHIGHHAVARHIDVVAAFGRASVGSFDGNVPIAVGQHQSGVLADALAVNPRFEHVLRCGRARLVEQVGVGKAVGRDESAVAVESELCRCRITDEPTPVDEPAAARVGRNHAATKWFGSKFVGAAGIGHDEWHLDALFGHFAGLHPVAEGLCAQSGAASEAEWLGVGRRIVLDCAVVNECVEYVAALRFAAEGDDVVGCAGTLDRRSRNLSIVFGNILTYSQMPVDDAGRVCPADIAVGRNRKTEFLEIRASVGVRAEVACQVGYGRYAVVGRAGGT